MRLFAGIDIGGSHIGIVLTNNKGSIQASDSVKINGKYITSNELIDTILLSIIRTLYSIHYTQFNNKYKYNNENISFDLFYSSCLANFENNKANLLDNFIIFTNQLNILNGIGIGCPGQCTNGIIKGCSNLPNLFNFPIIDTLKKKFNNPSLALVLLNDADAAICAEVWRKDSSSKEYKNAVMVTLGTGVGYSLILNNELYQGTNGLIEGGHAIIFPDFLSTPSNKSRSCGCGQIGCIETYASAKNASLRLSEMDRDEKLKSKEPSELKEINGKEMMERFFQNDFNAVVVLEETAKYLAILCINICRFIDPEVIIFGGGLSKAGKPFLSLIEKYIKDYTWKVLPTDVELIQAKYDDSGSIGAALASVREYESKNSTINTNTNFLIDSLCKIFSLNNNSISVSNNDDSSIYFGPLLVYHSSLPSLLLTSSTVYLAYKLINKLINKD